MIGLLIILVTGTVKHVVGDIWIGWSPGYYHHDWAGQVNHSGIDIGYYRTSDNPYDPGDTVTISSRAGRGVDYDSVKYWYSAYSSEGTNGRNLLEIYYVDGRYAQGGGYNPWDIKAWAESQIGKPYNYNLENWNQDNSFYCHQLVYRAFVNVAGIILNDSTFPEPGAYDWITAIDLAFSYPSRLRCTDYVPPIRNNGGGGGHHPPIEQMAMDNMNQAVNLLSDLEKIGYNNPERLTPQYREAVVALSKATERRFWNVDYRMAEDSTVQFYISPEYDSITHYIQIAMENLLYLPSFHKEMAALKRILGKTRRVRELAKNPLTVLPEDKKEVSPTKVVIEKNTIWISLELREKGDVTYTIFNSSGRKVQAGSYVSLNSGNHKLSIPVQNLPAGVYLISIKANKMEKKEKLTLLR